MKQWDEKWIEPNDSVKPLEETWSARSLNVVAESGEVVAYIVPVMIDDGTPESRATLMAAAPELYRALEAMVERFIRRCDEGDGACNEVAEFEAETPPAHPREFLCREHGAQINAAFPFKQRKIVVDGLAALRKARGET